MLFVTLALGGVASVLPASAEAALGVLRPTQGGGFRYDLQEAPPYIGSRSVVHYVSAGQDAPNLADADLSGVPDYVEQVSRAAERSLDFYASRGFKAPLPDSAGPNASLDIYIVDFTGNYESALGIAVPAQQSALRDGGFFLVGQDLESGLDVDAGLEVTVAHELFHLVQFAYFAPPAKLPNGTVWADEGTAVAMSMLVYPEIRDRNNAFVLDYWLKETWKPLYFMGDDDFCDVHCYAGAMWWSWLWRLDPALISEYYGRLYGYTTVGRNIGLGTQTLDEILKRRGFQSLYSAFTRFSVDTYRRGLPIAPAYQLTVGLSPKSHSFPAKLASKTSRKVAVTEGLSSHFVPVTLPTKAKGFDLLIQSALGPAPDLTLIVGGVNGRRISAKTSSFKSQGIYVRQSRFHIVFRNARERTVRLIVTSGRQDPVAYTVASDGF